MTTADQRHMRHALTLGARGLGRCWPNPAVGCVIVREGRIVGRGWTQPGGRPHAEAVALAQAGAAARGATAYVTLEPCAHTGKTPPCADALVAAGIARVVVALRDPDPRVDGGGLARLRAAGLIVDVGVCAREAAASHAGFLRRIRDGRPMVTLKLANSFDGRIATQTGDSQWITGPAARRLVHLERAAHDAVLVGGGTARDDDPSLTVRGLGISHQPVRVVASTRLDLPRDGLLARTARQVPVWLLHGAGADPDRVSAWTDLGAHCLSVETGPDGHLDAAACLRALGQAGLTRVFCEGGGQFAAALLRADLVDRLIGFTAGVAIGAEGRPSLGAMGLTALRGAPRFHLSDSRAIEGDVLHVWLRPGADQS
ncbi:bifunctional diaminohydroxyphosphoribosylaminopyrimidine deaminase/5-amino-6-(5-phosphoribosylamino)uracil reductase RibD [Meridianimarinicoccus sp. MJW13]|uniref:bifunctional diaminohydroxyphosphoribosylaminopyrimidine deaminase/5-amino-6-(5-phosphoribosylamino)uracil reductase RibD n=1 Tax=Meridianimarinicoccus sp. MJW13 TaxID=2720031 RepID=UPI00299F904F|nr:bifunctional diaminohydroxyphosphoribosylaminopyrimidine deaminase/5-amino-6-(5-phosphoribosylamino)uracil reductase RibD [Fluviibacterium sp. MJW13]